MTTDGLHVQKAIAMGKTPDGFGGDFGVEKLNSHMRSKHPDNGSKSQAQTLSFPGDGREGKRAASHPIPRGKKGKAQAAPDHGTADYL